ncbi:hypothetical protein [Microbacterium sp.]|uniref:hypothetical protein n=1 Tax=Microbacterium sp. TaxID=51671 RepID=UPI0028123BA3|nr:hypothetical protein [Microbacterium sp.]
MARRPLALTAAATIALGGLFFGSPAYAEETGDQPVEQTTEPTAEPTPTAEATEQPAAPVAEETPAEDAPPAAIVEAAEAAEEEGVAIVAFGVNAAGEDVVVVTAESTDAAEGDAAVKAFADSANLDDANVVTVASAPVAFAEGEVVGGQGYIGLVGQNAYACSIGFSAFAPDGSPALLSAGHCAYDQNNAKVNDTTLTIPNQEPAVGGPGYEVPAVPILLGEFGFAQFGSTGNAPGSDGDVNATDISVIDINELGGFSLLPEVTDWSTAGAGLGSLADGTISVKGVGSPVAGNVSKSGRTTGFTTGTIDGNDVLDGWAQIEDRWVRGFSSNTIAAPGDSGGSVIQGNTAVGVISGGTEDGPGGEQWTWATSLVHALPKISGYEVALDLDAPVVTSPAPGSTVVIGSTITGTAPGAELVEVTGVGAPFEVPVSNGTFSFAAPGAPGDYSYTLTSVNGFSTSESTSYALTVELAPTPAPVFTSPASGSTVTETVTSISGTGVPAASVVVTIDGVDYPATVDGSGNWTVTGLELTYGTHTVSAVQTANDDTSDAAESTFGVVPVAPAVTSVADGAEFAHDAGPSTLSGTGIDDSTITVRLDGAEPTSTQGAALAAVSGTFTASVVGGVWTVDFGAALEPGTYSVSATQTIDGVASAPTTLTFRVLAAPAPGGGGGAGDPGDGNLAETGVDMLGPISASAGALILLAGGITLMAMRRRTLMES